MTPAKHSNIFIVILYHKASMISRVTIFVKYGPNTTPAINQPKMAGSRSLETSFPTISATQKTANNRKNPTVISASPTEKKLPLLHFFPEAFSRKLRPE